MSEMQGLASAIQLLAAAAKDKIDDALLSEVSRSNQPPAGGSARFDRRDGRGRGWGSRYEWDSEVAGGG